MSFNVAIWFRRSNDTGTVGNLYPAWKAATTKLAEAMKYD
jgi:hypothetical protein